MKRLQGVTSNPQPIVSDRGVGEARALAGLASDIRGIASMQATTSTKGLPEDKQAEILAKFQQEDQALWASVQQTVHPSRQLSVFSNKRKLLVSRFIAGTPDEGLHKIFIQAGNDYDDPDMAMAAELQKKAVEAAGKYGLNINDPADEQTLGAIMEMQQKKDLATLKHEMKTAQNKVTEQDEKAFADITVDDYLTNFGHAENTNMSLLPDGTFGGVNEGLLLPELGTPMENKDDIAKVAAIFDGNYNTLRTKLQTSSSHLSDEDITNMLKPVKAKHDLLLNSFRNGYSKTEHEAATLFNNAKAKYETSSPEFQRAQTLINMVAEMPLTSQLALLKDEETKKRYDEAVKLVTTTLTGNKIPLNPETQVVIPSTIKGLLVSEDLSLEDANYIAQTLLPSVSTKDGVVQSAEPLSDEHLQTVIGFMNDPRAKVNMEKHPALKEAMQSVAVDYTNKLLKANFESLNDNMYYDYDSRTIKVHKEGLPRDQFYKLNNEAKAMNSSPLLAKMHKAVDALAGLTGDDPVGIIQSEIGGTIVGEGFVQQEGQPTIDQLSDFDRLAAETISAELGIPIEEAIGLMEAHKDG